MQMYVSAFPDLHFDIDQIFREGDYVTTRAELREDEKVNAPRSSILAVTHVDYRPDPDRAP